MDIENIKQPIEDIEKCNGDISTLLREGLATLTEEEQSLVRAYRMLCSLSDKQIEKVMEAFMEALKETEVNA